MGSKVKWVRLGDYIIQRREKNNSYELPIYGVTRDGFIPPKQKEADTQERRKAHYEKQKALREKPKDFPPYLDSPKPSKE